MSNREHTLTIEMLKELDALYEETEDMGGLGRRPNRWGTLVEELRKIRRLVEAGVTVKIEGTPTVLNTWESFYDWAHGRYHMLEDGYDLWIGDDYPSEIKRTAIKCPRCKLLNSDTAQRCACGFDFVSGTIEKSHFKQEIPKEIKTYLKFIVGLNVLVALDPLVVGDPVQLIAVVIWSVIIYWLYSKLVQKKNWARITLVILTFPIGLYLFFSQEIKLYFLQRES